MTARKYFVGKSFILKQINVGPYPAALLDKGEPVKLAATV